MKKAEADKLIDGIWHKVKRKGLPINVRTGDDLDAADWFVDIVKACIETDSPIGIEPGAGYDACPNCKAIVGQSAFYCKTCGAYLREGGR